LNEGDWITFDGKNSTGLKLEFEWLLDGIPLAGRDEIITALVDSGGEHVIGLRVHQDPVGEDYIESNFYADYKPTEILVTNPSLPRSGEDFELYLNAYDEEGEAVIEFLRITMYDFEGNNRAELLYEDQGANFNIVFEVEYTGNMILEYELRDEKGNFRANSSDIEVLGWADIYVESMNVSGKKEKGKTQNVNFVLVNYNETYQSVIYNGYTATGSVELLIDSEIVSTWNYEIEPNGKQDFQFHWIATSGSHEFEVVAYVLDGEENNRNNNLTKIVVIKIEKKSGILPYPSFTTIVTLLAIVSYINRRKPN
ncbi:MAG: hypothetical protein VYA07_00270, partial [Candidatus Thermoplasmatota archaeon]|nr:hypothetical protein [Candidatus Thermoplasmatota archaeon]